MNFIDASSFISVLVFLCLIFISKLPDDVLRSFTKVSCILCNHDEIGKFQEANWSKRSIDTSGDLNWVVYWQTKDSYLKHDIRKVSCFSILIDFFLFWNIQHIYCKNCINKTITLCTNNIIILHSCILRIHL